jgi:polysaccharide biosynthesis/export protein
MFFYVTSWARRTGGNLTVVIHQVVLQVAIICLCLIPSSIKAQQPTDNLNAAVGPVNVPAQGGLDQYRIGPSDQLSVQFFGKTQLSRDVSVDSRGMIRLPLIDEDIHAGCRTENELAEEIARAYRDRQLLKNPIVTVSVKEYQSQPVAVVGAVNSQGRFLLRRRVTLLEMLNFYAGGLSPKAGNKVEVRSTGSYAQCDGSSQNPSASVDTRSSREKIVTYNFRQLYQGNEDTDPVVRPGDIIRVPDAEVVYVVGNVLHPSAVPLLEPTTLAQAIAIVGGTLPNTKKDPIRVVRRVPGTDTETVALLINLKDKDMSKGENFLLQGGDRIEVSTKTGWSMILASLAKTVVPSVSNMPLQIIR